VTGYVLAPNAQEDLVAIRDYYVAAGGYKLARRMLLEFVDAFRTIARHPAIGHKREDLVEDRPVLFWPVRDYLVVYRTNTQPVEIVTIAHGRRDVAGIVKRRS
jgi:plasmid stabilization system protein ParE